MCRRLEAKVGAASVANVPFLIGSVDPNIHLPRAYFDPFIAEAHMELGLAGYTYTFDETTCETIIRNCDIIWTRFC